MEKILELGDSCINNYPQHFQDFLDNCLKTYGECFGPNDYLFAAVYFIILETGFSPVDEASSVCDDDSVDFDIRKLSSVTGYTNKQIKISDKFSSKKCCIYQVPLKLGKHSLCELQGVPSAEINTHLIINFLSKEPQAVKSLCLNTDLYVVKNETPSEHKFSLKNLEALSLKIKNKISVQIKDLILTSQEEGCSANLLCLPEEIQKKIIYCLIDDPCGVQALSSTCTYFYSLIKTDTKLWEQLCFLEFSGWELNKALQEICVTGDVNVFRTAFLYLKEKKNAWLTIDLLLSKCKQISVWDVILFPATDHSDEERRHWRTVADMSKTIRHIIQSSKGPKPVGPYNQAVRVNNLVYLSGVIGLDPKTNQIVSGGVENETKQIFHNMEAVLKAADSGFDKIVKASVFLNDINDFGKVNEIYKQFIVKDHPARSAYQVGRLPVGAKVEIEAIAICGEVETKYITE